MHIGRNQDRSAVAVNQPPARMRSTSRNSDARKRDNQSSHANFTLRTPAILSNSRLNVAIHSIS